MVQSFGSQVSPYGSILFFEEKAFFQSFHHLLFSFEIGVRFIIYFVEADAHLFIGLVESGVYPVVHHFPQSAYFRVTRFPLHEHFASFLHQRRCRLGFRLSLIVTHSLCCKSSHEFCQLRFIMFIERDIIIAYQMVAFLAGCLRSFTVSIFLPCQHRFTDMNTTVVYDISLYYLVAVGSYNVSQCVT